MISPDANDVVAFLTASALALVVWLLVWITRWLDTRPPSRREIRRRWESGEVEQMMDDAVPFHRRGQYDVGPPIEPVGLDNPRPPQPPPPTRPPSPSHAERWFGPSPQRTEATPIEDWPEPDPMRPSLDLSGYEPPGGWPGAAAGCGRCEALFSDADGGGRVAVTTFDGRPREVGSPRLCPSCYEAVVDLVGEYLFGGVA